MIEILQTIVTALESLLAGETFTSNAGGSAVFVVHSHVMPPRAKTAAADVMPFCLAKVREFRIYPSKRQTIELIFAIYNEDRADAMDDMERLTSLIEPLAVRGRNLGGWKIADISGFPGDKDTGVQPHPEYYLTVAIDLIAPPVQ